jgi:single-stranded DNA-binding protein
MARDAQPYDTALLHRMQGYIKQRSFTDKNGQTRYENQIIITRMN